MAELGRRQQHVQAVAALAAAVGNAFNGDRELLIAAALVHDIGYSPELATSGFHPLDGARCVRAAGHERLARLVAHHSGARYEARLRGIRDMAVEFPFENSALDQALTYCDLTTSPCGERVSLEQRIAEIQHRYGYDHLVSRAIRMGRREFERARDETERRTAEAGVALTGPLVYPPSGSPRSST
jgi:putative nucleotidyltransferase with HDIG domain